MSCKVQAVCGKGEHISPDSVVAVRTCVGCGDNEYMDLVGHRSGACDVQTFCGPGTYISVDSKVKARVCELCGDNQFQTIDFIEHRETSCEAQPFCNSGEFISPDSKIHARECSKCLAGTFMSANRHRNVECDPMTPCGVGGRPSPPVCTPRAHLARS
jgi:hypothetical protein